MFMCTQLQNFVLGSDIPPTKDRVGIQNFLFDYVSDFFLHVEYIYVFTESGNVT